MSVSSRGRDFFSWLYHQTPVYGVVQAVHGNWRPIAEQGLGLAGSAVAGPFGGWAASHYGGRLFHGKGGANDVPGSPNPDNATHEAYDALGMTDYRYGNPYGGVDQMGPPAPAGQFAGAVAGAEGSSVDPNAHPDFHNMAAGSQGGMNGVLGHTSSSYTPAGLASGGAPGFGWQGSTNVGGTMDSMGFFGNLPASTADIANARWYRNKVN